MFTPIVVVKRAAFTVLLLLAFMQVALAQQERTVPYTVVYKLKDTQNARAAQTTAGNLQQALAQVGATGVHRKFPKAMPLANARTRPDAVDLSLLYELQYQRGLTLAQVQRTLLSSGAVAYVEPLYIREPFTQPDDPSADSAKTSQYYLKLVQAYEGWSVEKSSSNIMIGILDTGTRLSHRELKDKISYSTADPIDGIDNDGDGYVDNYNGWDFADGDNNPSDDSQNSYKGHGTAVSGVAAAAANNGYGIAGLGYNSSVLPLKVFTSVKDGTNFGGYEAIVYAADKGCKVINLSWGGEGRSQFEQDIINYAVINKDVVIIAAGGNTDKKKPLNIYPASYQNVLSVGGTTAADVKYASYTYSYNIDLTAPSRDILTLSVTNDDQLSGGWGGTSFASPMVAGAAALVRAHYPDLNARQVMERIRATTDDIYHLAANKPYLEMLGRGRLNVKKALKATGIKSVRCTRFQLPEDNLPYAGTTLDIAAEFTNFLDPLNSLSVQLTSLSPYVTVEQGNVSLGSMATMAVANNSPSGFRIRVADDAPENSKAVLRLGFTDGTYTDYQHFSIDLNPSFVTLNANNLKVTINSLGNIAYNGLNLNQGVGVRYKNSSSLLFEGGLMVATDPTHVSDNIRDENYVSDGDFITTSNARLHQNTPLATQEARTVFHDAPSGTSVGVEVKHIAYAWNSEADQDYVILEYHIKNVTGTTIDKLYAGMFADWDIGNYTLNGASWDDENKFGYAYNTAEGSSYPYMGLKLLTNDSPSYYAIDNIGGGEGTIAIEDGFTSEEKFATLSGGIARTQADGNGSGNNIAQVVGASAVQLAPGQVKVIAFALLAGDNLEQLQQHARAAAQKYRSFRTGAAPAAFYKTSCAGSSATWAPSPTGHFNFYADSEKKTLLASGSAAYTLQMPSATTTVYATNVDSLFESSPVPGTFALPRTPDLKFKTDGATAYAGVAIRFQNQSTEAQNWQWTINGEEAATAENLTYTFHKPGSYEVTLSATDLAGCDVTSLTQTVEVLAPSPAVLAKALEVYPVPATAVLHLNLLPDGETGAMPDFTLTDITGKVMQLQATSDSSAGKSASISLKGLHSGVYFLRVNYSNVTITRRIVVAQ